MRAPASSPLTPFEVRWLAEIVYRHEARCGLLEDAAALGVARAQPPELEARILKRAELLGMREGWAEAIRRWRGAAGGMLALALLLALLAGAGLSAGLLGDGSRPVNVVWALGAMLGPHLLGVLLWGGLLAWQRPAAPVGALTRLGQHLARMLDRSPGARDRLAGLMAVLAQQRLGVWAAGAIGHLLWAAALGGSLLGLLLMLALRRYDFVWETTILPVEVFERLSLALGRIPSWLGFPVPDGVIVRAGGADAIPAPTFALAARQAWSGWLLGCLFVHGLLLRLALALLCALMAVRARARLSLDLSRPGHALLRERLLPASAVIGIRDPAPSGLQPAAACGGPAAGEGACIAALELADDLPWPPDWVQAAAAVPPAMPGPAMLVDLGRLDERIQRHAALEHCRQHPPQQLLLAIDARMTPDRGSLGLILSLARLAACIRIWALNPDPAGPDRLSQWREAIKRSGLGAEVLLVDAAAVRHWLQPTS